MKNIFSIIRILLPVLLIVAMAYAQTESAIPAPNPAAVNAKRVRVGVTVCQFQHTGPSWIGVPNGFRELRKVLEQLRDTSVELVPVIEPDTEAQEQTSDMLHTFFKKEKPVSMYDAKALEGLEVLIVVDCSDIHQEALDAIEKAATQGLNLIVVTGVGVCAPETNAQTQRIAGLDSAIYGWNPGDVKCKVMKAHPLLGDLKEGTEITLNPNGMFGLLKDATSLVEVTDMSRISVPERDKAKEADMVFPPLYVSKIGKGQIVGVGWASYQPVPQDIDQATDGRFYERSALWLAGRALPVKDQAEVDFEKYGVRFKREGGTPDGPIVEVMFTRGKAVTDDVLGQIKGFDHLQRLYLKDAINVTDAGLEHLKGLKTLQLLMLTGAKITDAGLVHLQDMKELQWLDLSEAKVTDAGLEHLKGLEQMQFLNLLGTQVTDAGLEHLAGLKQLQNLVLSATQVTDAGLEHLKGLDRLRWLYLRDISVTDQGIKNLKDALPECQVVH